MVIVGSIGGIRVRVEIELVTATTTRTTTTTTTSKTPPTPLAAKHFPAEQHHRGDQGAEEEQEEEEKGGTVLVGVDEDIGQQVTGAEEGGRLVGRLADDQAEEGELLRLWWWWFASIILDTVHHCLFGAYSQVLHREDRPEVGGEENFGGRDTFAVNAVIILALLRVAMMVMGIISHWAGHVGHSRRMKVRSNALVLLMFLLQGL